MRTADFVSSYFDAWNHHNAREVASHLAENGTYFDVPIHQQMSRRQLIDYLEESFDRDTSFYALTGEVLRGDNTIAFQYRVSPRQPDPDREASDTWFGAEFITLQGGMAIEIADYYDQPGLVVPGAPITGTANRALVQRYAKSGLSCAQLSAVKLRLSTLMDVDKTYLQPDLTLPQLAEMLGCTVNHLSQAINAGFGMSFFDYLNQYRIKDAIGLLCQSYSTPRTVLSVALDVGFNTTSTFYVAFKKVTGRTPAQYRQAHAQGVAGRALQ